MKKLFLILILFLPFYLCGQKISLKGQITDSLSTPLPFANIIADPVEEGSIAFSFSDEKGNYRLSLEKNITYSLTVSHMGFLPDTLTFKPKKDSVLNFKMQPASESLDAVKLTYRQPIKVKEDTLIYRTDVFATGRERKLRDLIRNLPGMEIDRAGNVKVQGKKVTRVMVEDKIFFTGDSKLAVNNIPADAVDEIEVMDNYSRVGFLKGLEDSEEMAMNIRLKKEKKQFVFGEIEAGGGIENRYKLSPSLYYYSPKTTFNLLGDLNNTGQKSFTLNDYRKLEENSNKLIMRTRGYSSVKADDFAQSLSQSDYKKSINKFAGLSFSHDFNAKSRLASYGIWSAMNNQTQVETINNYYSLGNTLEDRQDHEIQKPNFGIGKLSLESLLNTYTDLSLNTYFKYSNSHFLDEFSSVIQQDSYFIKTNRQIEDLSFRQEAEWHKQFNKKHTTSASVQYEFKKDHPNTEWFTDRTILEEILPWVAEPIYKINQFKENSGHHFDAVLKHYLVLNRFNHLYFSLGGNLSFDKYSSSEAQVLEDQHLNDFSTAGFGNELNLNLRDLYSGIQYKTQQGNLTVRPGLFLHQYFWTVQQFGETGKHQKTLLLPELNAKLKLKNAHLITFDYKLKSQFPQVSQFAEGYILQSFNRVFRGNRELNHELYHQLNLWLNKIDLPNNLFYHLLVGYNIYEKRIVNTLINEKGIDFISTPAGYGFENQMLNLNGKLEKGFGKIKANLGIRLTKVDYETPFNDKTLKQHQNSSSFNIGLRTNYDNFPNLDLSYQKSFSSFMSVSKSKFETDIFSATLEYNILENIGVMLDYEFENYKNKSLGHHNFFNIANATVFYEKKNSPWRFEVTGSNIFNERYKRRNSFSSLVISDKKTFILPGMVLLNIVYKL